MWGSYPKFDAQTGKELKNNVITLDDLRLEQFEGIFLEDKIHDWNVVNGKLNYYSRIVGQGDKVKILIDYEGI